MPDRHPGAADTRHLHAMADHHAGHHQRQEQVVVQRDRGELEATKADRLAQVEAEELERVDLVDALGSVGDVDRMVQIVQEHANDFTETQRHDRQVVAAQLQRGRAQQHAEQSRQPGPCRNDHPQRHVQPVREGRGQRREGFRQVRRRQQAVHVGTHRKKGHIAQIQQAGVTDHNVQAQGQQHIKQGHVSDAHPGIAEALQHHRQHQQSDGGDQENNGLVLFHLDAPGVQARSATRSPSRPEGRSVSTMISTMKAKMSE